MTSVANQDQEKLRVRDFWNEESCGEKLYLASNDLESYDFQAKKRYQLEPYINDFADFTSACGKKVLEIGVGLGADHQRFAEAGADLYGIDLTKRAVEHTDKRLQAFGINSKLTEGDAENLAFPDESFDLVYSWGVLHHSPHTDKAVAEVYRVLKTGGWARIMIYHKWSMVGLMLWLRYALLVCKPWRSLGSIYAAHLESPGTKAYSVAEAERLFADFSDVRIMTVLTHGDLLESGAGQRHQGVLLNLARLLWPRRLLKLLCPSAGLYMLIKATK